MIRVSCLGLGVGLALAACQPAAQPLDPALAGELTLLGTEPFWAIEIDASGTATLTRPDDPGVTLSALKREATADGARFKASSAGGDMVMTLKAATCSDGMSDRVYPFEAQVEWGGQSLKGCAITPDEMARTAQ